MPRQGAVPGISTARDDSENPRPQLADYYRWEEPDRRIRIYINFETADRLQVQVFRGIDDFPDGGVEVGGILLGRREAEFDRGWTTTVIDDFEPVPCSYSNGSRYSLKGAEAVLFESTLVRCGSDATSGLSVVGYYRSHKRNALCLSADDLTFIQSVFPGPDNVFLLIKPLPMRACTAGFFFWEDGKVQSEFTLEVPFAPIRSLSAGPGDDPAEDLLPLIPIRLDRSVNPATIPPGESMEPVLPSNSRWHGRARDVAAVVLGITLSLAGVAYWQARRSEMARLAPAARRATGRAEHPAPGGALTLPEGAEKGLLTSDGMENMPAKPTGAMQRGSSRHDRQQPAFIANPAPRQDNPNRALSRKSPVSATDHPSDPAPAAGAKPEQTPPLLLTETKINELAVATTVLNPPPPLRDIAPPAIAPPSPQASPLEVGPPQQPSQVSFVGPQIIYRVNPAVPSDVKALIASETQIDVTVSIDLGGRVTGAQVTSTRGAAARLVASEAIRAARLFRFQPARENGRAVTSKMVLTFRFRRSGE